MSASVVSKTPSRFSDLGDEALIGAIVDSVYDKMLDDYRVNRFFSGRPVAEQTGPLKAYLNAALGGRQDSDSELLELLNGYFMSGFARTNAKHSLVTGNDFAFLLDIIGGPEAPRITLLCDAHSHLIKLGPDDFHYDVAMEHLSDSLTELGLSEDVMDQILAMAENARNGVLGRGGAGRQAA